MTSRVHSSQRGFTLTELAVAAAVASLTITMVVMIVIAQQRSLQSTEMMRTSSESGRDALFELERMLRRAGFGIDPRFVFDFRSFRCPDAERIPAAGGRRACRDRIDAPDRLVFVARNPAYRVDTNEENGCAAGKVCTHGMAWAVKGRVTSSTSPKVTLALHKNQKLLKGQTLLISCAGGARYTMSTVEFTTRQATSEADEIEVSLYKPDAARPNPYFENAFADACFDSGALAFAVDRFAYSIQTIGGVPWLVLDQGVDRDGDGRDPWEERDDDDLIPVVPYVEDLQVAYVFDRSSGRAAVDTNANYVTGDDGAQNSPEEPDPAANAPAYDSATDSELRATLHPGNIRAVRVSLTLRSERPDLSAGMDPKLNPDGGVPAKAWVGDPLPAVENSRRTLSAAELGRFRRQSVVSTVALRNLVSRSMFTF